MQYKNFFWISVLFLGLLHGCRKENIREVPFVAYVNIPAGLNVLYTHYFDIHDVIGIADEGKIIEAQPTRLRLTAISGEPNFDFVQQAYINAITDTSSMEMGFLIDPPITGSSTLEITPSIIDLKDHITKTYFSIQLKTVFRNITSDLTQVRIDFTVRLKEED